MSGTKGSNLKSLIKSLPNRGGEEENKGNPFKRGYCGWGAGEDAMTKDGDWWDCTKYFDSWKVFCDEWNIKNGLDPELNLIADFYFSVSCDSKPCEICDQSGVNPATKVISDDFYDYSSSTGKGWHDQITQDEVEALVAAHRLVDLTHKWEKDKGWVKDDTKPMPTAEEVNAFQRKPGAGLMSHDAINRWILIETRAKRMGVWGHCDVCKGEGSVKLSDDYLVLNLWMLHPRKGASRGIQIKNVPVEALPEIKEFLAKSWELHENHFKWVHGKGKADE